MQFKDVLSLLEKKENDKGAAIAKLKQEIEKLQHAYPTATRKAKLKTKRAELEKLENEAL